MVDSVQCPQCHTLIHITAYDIGDGPEYSCSHCEWCWGAEGQPLSMRPIEEGVRLMREEQQRRANPGP